MLYLAIVFLSLFDRLELVRLSRRLHQLHRFAESTQIAIFVIDLSVRGGSHLRIDLVDSVQSAIQVIRVLLVQEVGNFAMGGLCAELAVVGLLSVLLIDGLFPVDDWIVLLRAVEEALPLDGAFVLLLGLAGED